MKNYKGCTNKYRLTLFNEREKIYEYVYIILYFTVVKYYQIFNYNQLKFLILDLFKSVFNFLQKSILSCNVLIFPNCSLSF